MRILYLGARSGTSLHRARALERLGHQIHLLDPADFVPAGAYQARLHYETGGLLCANRVENEVIAALGNRAFDRIWVDNGRYVGAGLIQKLRQRYGQTVNYNLDDPYGRRDRGSWLLYRKAVPAYDLIVVVREQNVAEALARGAKKAMRVFRSADEIAHTPRNLTDADRTRWGSEVLFLGTAMPERGLFVTELLRQETPLTIYGNRWQKLREWPLVCKAWRGPATTTDADYAAAIQCARICLGLLSRGNRDLHTQRSLEIPSLGGLLCAERTSEHQQMYVENEEAVFWSDASECAHLCNHLLANERRRQEIAWRGRERFLQDGHRNETVMAHILQELC